MATFLNEDDEPEPRLGQCCMQEQPEVEKVEKAEKQDVQEQGQHEVQGQGQLEGQGQGQVQECKQGLGKGPDSSSTSSSSADVPMQVLWCIQEVRFCLKSLFFIFYFCPSALVQCVPFMSVC